MIDTSTQSRLFTTGQDIDGSATITLTPEAFPSSEGDFIHASAAAVEAQHRKKARVRRRITTSLLLLTCIASLGAFWAWKREREAPV